MPCHSYPETILRPPGHWSSAAIAVGDLSDESITLNIESPPLMMVAKYMEVQTSTHSPVSVHSKRSDLTIVETALICATRTRMTVMRTVADVAASQLFYVLMTNVLRNPIYVRKDVVVAHAINPPKAIVAIKISLTICNQVTVVTRRADVRSMNETS